MAADLDRLFGIQLTISVYERYAIKVGVGSNGIELVQKLGESSPAERLWRGPLAALVLEVEDAEGAVQRMTSAGFALDHVTEVGADAREYSFGTAFHDLPLVLYSGTAPAH